MGCNMSSNEVVLEERRNDTTTDTSDDDDDNLFNANLEDITSENRTFRNIISLLVGRQSVRHTLRLLREESLIDGSSDDSDDSSDNEQTWGFHPRPSPAVQHPPDTSTIKKSDIHTIITNSMGNYSRRSKECTFGKIMERSIHGGYGKRKMQKQILTSAHLLPHNGVQVAKYNKKVFCGTHARDGQLFITACPDKIRLYDTRFDKFKLLQTIEPREVGWSVLDVGVSQDGRQLVYSSWCDSLHFVAVGDDPEDEAGSQHYNLQLNPRDHNFCIFSVSFSDDSREILGGANDGCLYVYDRGVAKQTSRIQAHKDDINAVSFVDKSTHLLASGSDDGLLKIWDRRTLNQEKPSPVGVLAGHTDGITYIDPKGDGRHLISNSKDQSIKLWDIRQFSSESAISQSNSVIADQNWDYRWQKVPRNVLKKKTKLEGDSSVMTYTGHTILQTLIRCHFSPEHTTGQSLLYTGCAAGRVVIYDVLTGRIVKVLNGHKGCVRDVSWHPYNQEIISSSWDFTVKKWTGVEKVKEADEKNKKIASSGDELDKDSDIK